MKLRTHDDSLRLRLDRAEVDAIGRGEAVQTQARFPGGAALVWRLEVGGQGVAAELDGSRVCVRIDADIARGWALVESEVSIRAEVPCAGAGLRVLIEKDFECLEPRAGETQANRFANPKRDASGS